MVDMPRLTPQTVEVLRALLSRPATPRWGRDIGQEVGLKSGTLHPILARLERAGVVESFWELPDELENQGRPRRRYYRLTTGGAQAAQLAIAEKSPGHRTPLRHRPYPQLGY
jgi:DNA-binding PadR family transcriptional regulator